MSKTLCEIFADLELLETKVTGRFVVHEHYARNLHYDFRLELNGTLKSWAIPKGPSMNPNDHRLAVPTANHHILYIDYEGVIPRDNYGAGLVSIWDSGIFRQVRRTRFGLYFNLKGDILKGDFAIKKWSGRQVLSKLPDEYSQLDWVLIPKVDSKSALAIKEFLT